MTVLRWSAIVGVVGMLLTIVGGGTTLGFLFSKAIAQPRGVAIYNPNLTVRDIDVESVTPDGEAAPTVSANRDEVFRQLLKSPAHRLIIDRQPTANATDFGTGTPRIWTAGVRYCQRL